MIDFIDKLRSFIIKVDVWENKDENLSMFENLDEKLKNKITENLHVTQLVQAYLVSLQMELQSYFPELSEVESKLLRNPFIVNVQSLPDSIQEEFLELVNDSVAKDAFETLSLTKFWMKMSVIYSVVSDVVLNSLRIFPSTYQCEQGCSMLLNIKSKLDHGLMWGMTYACACLMPLLELKNLFATNRYSLRTKVYNKELEVNISINILSNTIKIC